MMECFQVVLLFILLVPVPTASPVFIFLYLLAVFLAVSPCGSCIGWCAILFLATSPSSPFISSSPPNLPIQADHPLSSPTEERRWLSWNSGRIWDPSLVGYSHFVDTIPTANSSETTVLVDIPNTSPPTASPGGEAGLLKRVWSLGRRVVEGQRQLLASTAADADASVDASGDAIGKQNTAEEVKDEGSARLPPQYLDLRWTGLGFVLDLGWKRSEEGLSWELEEWKRASSASRASIPSSPPLPQVTSKSKRSRDSWLSRMPLIGSW